MAQNGHKMGSFHLFVHNKWFTITFGKKRVFDTVFGPFFGPKMAGPLSRYFWTFHGLKRVITGSKQAKNTCLSIPSGLGTTLERMFCFFALGPWSTHRWPPLCPARAASSSTK